MSPTIRAAANARVLRRSLTEPERRLWWNLRHHLPTNETHFRRQVALGPYVVDFCCHSAKLVIEVDGGQHSRDADLAYDARRTAAIEAQGFRVLRFGNATVMRDMRSVLDTIFTALADAEAPGGVIPTSHSAPRRGGEPPET
ncbi:endonuclease domain-containing protein [Methylorubrum sp. SB2]|uniref:endonuclease domain-containing protein n=1 Tax=Methylorubrum subtropicum TaxID=3138812 RepID=UPI00313BCDEA